ncbi:EscU/YscU/HrcU family type III secretion system export apparatus switch protein [Helicobacter sp. 11S02629-2]|uniref:EscU/YscU/HrcU family type III secretion system export apparatus switch protein n=1 Tax=Helicobacter sp. 11S02629-2 TaxID=1476195 RepID=UPI000BA65561|nr:EscU/YscU/HrcU family type III secretion system export apparatus switch protein [Helicobacter sp. 11S02629-2]PAF45459.1 flagellar biosynthesis protein FlhB [Helicobacter sp. 11S02629-2]
MHKKAAALAYDKDKDSSPRLVASGVGQIAQAIIQKAEEFDVPLFKNEVLVDSLVHMDLNANVPPELYQAVVEVFVWLQNTEKNTQISRL